MPEAGKTTRWSLELNSPNNLKRQGWSLDAVKPGDKVTVRMNPLRDGQPGGLFLDLRFPERQSARFRLAQERQAGERAAALSASTWR